MESRADNPNTVKYEPGNTINTDTAKIIAEIFSHADGGCSHCAMELASVATNKLGGMHDWKELTQKALYG